MAAGSGADDLVTTVVTLAQYQAQQCNELPAVVEAIAPLDGKDPFVTGTPQVG